MEHVSVLKKDVENCLAVKEGATVIDATLGLGGHAKDILKKLGKSGRLYAFEQDERNLKEARERLKEFESQITYIHDNFRHLKSRIIGKIDAILFDLGLSSPHVDEAGRGFSFKEDGPLDMRFDQRNRLTASVVVNTYSEQGLVEIFSKYGEERLSKKIARDICAERKKKTFETTKQLADFLEAIYPKKFAGKAHPATRIFQAIRIEVNDELNVLSEVLNQAAEILSVGGRIVVISYHSLEDRIVKQYFNSLIHPKHESTEQSIYSIHGEPYFEALNKKPIIPSEVEIVQNPRSRSAKLRAYRKLRELPDQA